MNGIHSIQQVPGQDRIAIFAPDNTEVRGTRRADSRKGWAECRAQLRKLMLQAEREGLLPLPPGDAAMPDATIIADKPYERQGLLFFGFSKADPDQRIVEGFASSEKLDSQDEIVDPDAIKAAINDFMEWANLREMHQARAIGKVLELKPIQGIVTVNGKKIVNPLYIKARIVDDDVWSKIKEGVYKGFSIGGKVLRYAVEKAKEGAEEIKRIVEMALHEISVVDRPANTDAMILSWKGLGIAPDPAPAPVEEPIQEAPEAKPTFAKVAALASEHGSSIGQRARLALEVAAETPTAQNLREALMAARAEAQHNPDQAVRKAASYAANEIRTRGEEMGIKFGDAVRKAASYATNEIRVRNEEMGIKFGAPTSPRKAKSPIKKEGGTVKQLEFAGEVYLVDTNKPVAGETGAYEATHGDGMRCVVCLNEAGTEIVDAREMESPNLAEGQVTPAEDTSGSEVAATGEVVGGISEIPGAGEQAVPESTLALSAGGLLGGYILEQANELGKMVGGEPEEPPAPKERAVRKGQPSSAMPAGFARRMEAALETIEEDADEARKLLGALFQHNFDSRALDDLDAAIDDGDVAAAKQAWKNLQRQFGGFLDKAARPALQKQFRVANPQAHQAQLLGIINALQALRNECELMGLADPAMLYTQGVQMLVYAGSMASGEGEAAQAMEASQFLENGGTMEVVAEEPVALGEEAPLHGEGGESLSEEAAETPVQQAAEEEALAGGASPEDAEEAGARAAGVDEGEVPEEDEEELKLRYYSATDPNPRADKSAKATLAKAGRMFARRNEAGMLEVIKNLAGVLSRANNPIALKVLKCFEPEGEVVEASAGKRARKAWAPGGLGRDDDAEIKELEDFLSQTRGMELPEYLRSGLKYAIYRGDALTGWDAMDRFLGDRGYAGTEAQRIADKIYNAKKAAKASARKLNFGYAPSQEKRDMVMWMNDKLWGMSVSLGQDEIWDVLHDLGVESLEELKRVPERQLNLAVQRAKDKESAAGAGNLKKDAWEAIQGLSEADRNKLMRFFQTEARYAEQGGIRVHSLDSIADLMRSRSAEPEDYLGALEDILDGNFSPESMREAKQWMSRLKAASTGNLRKALSDEEEEILLEIEQLGGETTLEELTSNLRGVVAVSEQKIARLKSRGLVEFDGQLVQVTSAGSREADRARENDKSAQPNGLEKGSWPRRWFEANRAELKPEHRGGLVQALSKAGTPARALAREAFEKIALDADYSFDLAMQARDIAEDLERAARLPVRKALSLSDYDEDDINDFVQLQDEIRVEIEDTDSEKAEQFDKEATRLATGRARSTDEKFTELVRIARRYGVSVNKSARVGTTKAYRLSRDGYRVLDAIYGNRVPANSADLSSQLGTNSVVIQQLVRAGLLEEDNRGELTLTSAGEAAYEDFDTDMHSAAQATMAKSGVDDWLDNHRKSLTPKTIAIIESGTRGAFQAMVAAVERAVQQASQEERRILSDLADGLDEGDIEFSARTPMKKVNLRRLEELAANLNRSPELVYQTDPEDLQDLMEAIESQQIQTRVLRAVTRHIEDALMALDRAAQATSRKRAAQAPQGELPEAKEVDVAEIAKQVLAGLTPTVDQVKQMAGALGTLDERLLRLESQPMPGGPVLRPAFRAAEKILTVDDPGSPVGRQAAGEGGARPQMYFGHTLEDLRRMATTEPNSILRKQYEDMLREAEAGEGARK